MSIKISQYEHLHQETKTLLNTIIKREFGHIPIVQETKWATPDWTVIYYHDDQIASFLNIIERNISIDNNICAAAGLNNVITLETYRGMGFSGLLLQYIDDLIFNNLKLDMGLLLCAPDLIPFYQRFKWYQVNCPVFFEQPEGIRLWTSEVMLRTPNKELKPGEIHLQGLPW